jgi:hypothetical protein
MQKGKMICLWSSLGYITTVSQETLGTRVASKDSFISGTFSRGELRSQEHLTAKLMGINVAELEKSKENSRY